MATRKPAAKKPVRKPAKYRTEMCETVIACGRRGDTIVQMARELGVTRETFYVWEREREDFRAAMKMARTLSQAAFDDIGKAGLLGKIERFNGPLWQFMAVNRFGDDYAAKQEISGPRGGPIESRTETTLDLVDHAARIAEKILSAQTQGEDS